MTRNEFMSELEKLLKKLPAQEREDILFDYQSHFDAGLANGKSEEEIAKSLGQPSVIAKEMSVDYHITVAKNEPSFKHVGRAVVAMMSLGFFNLIFVLGPFIALIGVLISLYAAAFALLVTPLALFYPLWSKTDWIEWLQILFLSLASFGLGLLLSVGMIYVTRWFYKGVLKYLQMNLRIIKGRNE